MALIPAGERPTETGAKSAVKIGRRQASNPYSRRASIRRGGRHLVEMSGINKTLKTGFSTQSHTWPTVHSGQVLGVRLPVVGTISDSLPLRLRIEQY